MNIVYPWERNYTAPVVRVFAQSIKNRIGSIFARCLSSLEKRVDGTRGVCIFKDNRQPLLSEKRQHQAGRQPESPDIHHCDCEDEIDCLIQRFLRPSHE
jgi:hypothetical protein